MALFLYVPTAVASTQVLEYNVVHPWLGKIGTFVNSIVRRGVDVTVTSSLRVVANLLGVTAHREYADRVEVWHGGHLIGFNGVTTINGKPFSIRGQLAGNHFIINSPDGTIMAPADVHPNNPWSCNFVNSTSVFAVNTGTVEPTRVTGGQLAPVEIGGRWVWARNYRVESALSDAHVWLDQTCVPVRMDMVVSGTSISVVLASERDTP